MGQGFVSITREPGRRENTVGKVRYNNQLMRRTEEERRERIKERSNKVIRFAANRKFRVNIDPTGKSKVQ